MSPARRRTAGRSPPAYPLPSSYASCRERVGCGIGPVLRCLALLELEPPPQEGCPSAAVFQKLPNLARRLLLPGFVEVPLGDELVDAFDVLPQLPVRMLEMRPPGRVLRSDRIGELLQLAEGVRDRRSGHRRALRSRRAWYTRRRGGRQGVFQERLADPTEFWPHKPVSFAEEIRPSVAIPWSCPPSSRYRARSLIAQSRADRRASRCLSVRPLRLTQMLDYPMMSVTPDARMR